MIEKRIEDMTFFEKIEHAKLVREATRLRNKIISEALGKRTAKEKR